jgi:acetyl-CoA synthetase
MDKMGYFRIQGRVDDVIKVSGHRLGSMEIESSLVSHPSVAEAAAIGKPDEIKGERVKVFVILKNGVEPTDDLAKELKNHVRKVVGALATPDELEFVSSLPKTRSGKIMRRVVKARELGEPVGDITTLDA